MADEKKDKAPADSPEVQALKQQIESLKGEIAMLKGRPVGDPIEVQTMVREKMSVGLDYQTALEAARAQYAHDQNLAAQAAQSQGKK